MTTPEAELYAAVRDAIVATLLRAIKRDWPAIATELGVSQELPLSVVIAGVVQLAGTLMLEQLRAQPEREAACLEHIEQLRLYVMARGAAQ